jgi:DNA repair exonuclease SbcCD ATPase subunit
LNGIVGIFGPNRAGKSSIVGTILYNLFNATDRGSIKNMYVCNVRKPFCYTRAVIDVNGVNYVIERQTTKHENRRGVQNAATALNVFRIDESGDAADLAGEQRLDTEKIIRGLIGNVDDFLLTSLSAQDDVSAFIKQGTTKRRQILSRFLDLDIFDKMYALANDDLKSVKSQLKIIPDKDWSDIVGSYKKNLQQIQADDESCTQRLRDANEQLNDARLELTKHGDQALVTQTQVDSQKKRVEQLEQQATKLTSDISTLNGDIERISAKLLTIEEIKKDNDVVSLKQRLDILSTLESSVTNLRLILDKECAILKQQERSTKILDDVPCGDSFPKCKFIKDAYLIRQKIDSQRSRVSKAQEKFDAASIELNNANIVDIRSKLDKLQQLHDRFAKLQLDASNKRTAIVKLESQRDLIVSQLEPAKAKLEVLEEALKNDENVEVVSLRSKIDNCLGAISRLDSDRLRLASERGKIISDIEKVHQEKRSREQLLQKMQVFELIAMAFSKKGIPSVIVGSQLPVINGEIAKILAGIVNFTIELEADEESDSMDVFINYGDSRRIIELASGMEKLISSMAIRVALINVSTLPKTNMLIIDEGFGALDDAGIESCNRLLVSLKRYFRTLLIITHVDAVKDVADQIIEVTKDEKDAHVSVE